MIQSVLNISDLAKCFTYLECMRTTHKKFSTGFWSQKSLCEETTQSERIFWSLPQLQRLEFQKSTWKLVFLQFKMFRWSHGHDAKYDASPCSRRMFYIVRTNADDSLKIFYGFQKSQVFAKDPRKMTEYYLARQNFRDLNVKNQFKIHSKTSFPSIKNVLLVARPWFKVRYISLIYENVSHTRKYTRCSWKIM